MAGSENMSEFNDYTQHVTPDEALKEYCRNPELRNYLETDRFVYVEGVFVLNNSQTIYCENGILFLTDYARENLMDCALSFEIKRTYEPDDDVLGDTQDFFGRGK